MYLLNYMIPCTNKSIFGVDCMGCGTQRSLYLLVNGNFIAAFKMFPPIFTTILLFLFIGLHFIDKSRNYHKMIILFAIINGLFTIVSYFYKQLQF
jgi:hypothetical protein